jgi:hypothetical protein
MTRESRDVYGRVFNDLGATSAGNVLDEIVDFGRMELSERYATYAATRVINGETRVNIITFFRDSHNIWRIESL